MKISHSMKNYQEGIEEAWNNRVAGSVSWGVGHTKIVENRRAV